MALQGSLLFYVFTTLITVCTRQPLTTALSTSTEVQTVDTMHGMRTNGTLFAWSTWGAWGACSRTCGGGVAVQERQCLPRDPTRWRRSRKRRKLTRSVDLGRRSRNVITRPEPDCAGLGRRYHECNTAPCPGSKRDSRAEQCAVYDRRPFRGRFYTWVPYVDGNAPCILNCRPRGQQFYASLALVADGTPCTKPGFRAICVQGSCKILDCNPTQKESSRGGHVMCPVKCNAIHVQFCVTLINRKAVDGAQRETATVFTEPA